MKTTYQISFNGTDYTQIYPSNEPKVTLTREAGEMFSRWRVDLFRITATKNASVYATLYSWFYDTTKFGTEIYYRIQENAVTTHEFRGTILLGKIDTQNSVYECNPAPDDTYRSVMLGYDTKFTRGTMFLSGVNTYYPLLESNLFLNDDISNFTDTDGDVTWENLSGGEQSAFLTLSTIPVGSGTGDDSITNIFITNFTGDNFTLRLVNQAFSVISNQVAVSANGLVQLTCTSATATTIYLELAVAGGDSGSFTYECYSPKFINYGISLYSLIDRFLNYEYCLNLSIGTVYSTYLWNDALESDPPPNIETYITANPNNDYVVEGTAVWNDIIIFPTFAVVDPTANPEPDVKISLKDVMDILKVKLRAWWFIDSDGHFRIEHDKYFRDYTSQINITTGSYLLDKPEVDASIYTYNLNGITNQVNLKEQNEGNEDWQSSPIVYSSLVTSGESEDINIQVSSDIKYMSESSKASSDGITIARTTLTDATYNIIFENSTSSPGTYYLNTKLGWWYLCANYYSYFANAETGTINGAVYNFDHVKEFLEQEKVRFHYTGLLNWKKPITLNNGTGWIITAERMPETSIYEIIVGFNPYA